MIQCLYDNRHATTVYVGTQEDEEGRVWKVFRDEKDCLPPDLVEYDEFDCVPPIVAGDPVFQAFVGAIEDGGQFVDWAVGHVNYTTC